MIQLMIWTNIDFVARKQLKNAIEVRALMSKYIVLFHVDVIVISFTKGQQYVKHYSDVRMGAIASQITSLTIVYSTVYSDADQRKHQSSASLAFVWGIHRGPGNSPHKWPVTRKIFPFDDVIMTFYDTLIVGHTIYTFMSHWAINKQMA